ncbi:MAG: exosome complex exonuclease Rrp41 [Candidatus Marsarchaeota archaeon]|jgi:exosome complex component RRP41|nr:exosome complex exonuclease Rrp41 [Candidatus Marsarchaeota archaeon]
MASKANKPKLLEKGRRRDGRALDELRDIRIKAGVLNNADGSAYVEWGNNRILAAVYGPREVIPKHFSNPNGAIVKCRYSMAPFSSLEGHGRSGQNRRSIEISKVIKDVFENVIILGEFPDSEIDIFMEVLQGDGSTRAACINAASVALASAGIPMRDLVYSVSIGKIDGEIGIDMDMIEDNYSDADMPIAVSPRNNGLLLLQMDGDLSESELKKGFDMALEAGKRIHNIQREALSEMYKGV